MINWIKRRVWQPLSDLRPHCSAPWYGRYAAWALWVVLMPLMVAIGLIGALVWHVIGYLGRGRLYNLAFREHILTQDEQAQLHVLFGNLLSRYKLVFSEADEAKQRKNNSIQLSQVLQNLQTLGSEQGNGLDADGLMAILRNRAATACAGCKAWCCTAFTSGECDEWRVMPNDVSVCRHVGPDSKCQKYEDRPWGCQEFVCGTAAREGRAPTADEYLSSFFADNPSARAAHLEMVEVYRAHPEVIHDFLRCCSTFGACPNSRYPAALTFGRVLMAKEQHDPATC